MNYMQTVKVNNQKATIFVIGAVPVRFNLWIMIFTSCWVVYMLRVNMSLNIIAMVPQTHSTSNTTSVSQCNAKDAIIRNVTLQHEDIADVRQAPRETPGAASFEWTPDQQAMILGSYFWCYPVTSLVGGMAAERWGPRYVVFITSVLSALLTIGSPAAARLHYIALVVARFLLGIAGGFIYPSLHALVARWAPPTEKGKFISAMMGGTLGTVVTWSVTGPLVEKFGWASAFYVPGALALIWCALWWYLVADTPADHPRISDTERKYISDALGDKVQKSKGLPPFKSIVTSLPFLAMVVLHYGNLWGLYFIMTVGPKFVSSVLGFQLAAAGVISALPYLARLLLSAIFGVIGDCPDPAKAPHKKAKMRRERTLEKLKEKGIDITTLNNTNKNKEKQVEDFINELPNDVKLKLEVKLVRTAPASPEWQATKKETFEVYFKYQTVIHNDKPEKCTNSKFLDFLVQSPLLEEHSETGPPCGYGSFHQQYWLDGKLIAVGVIDILPKCVSSVYFFYDPKYTNLTLGTYGALREIAFTRHLHSLCPELQYYYMGYLHNSCTTMRYKGNFYSLRLIVLKLQVVPAKRLHS
ncbi:hypothetical protein MSG28_013198 [Choristoneura fumiferana]|uniref:Uncharacterized protein n=1 Tax=Choristoneura fumiferana TaxID=7141 RepID=A0ACC0KSV6_CHOFU|nr:hypothetical protein MSG28_013198 [Choristoneura fumiferana]